MKKRIVFIISILCVLTLVACTPDLEKNPRLSELRSDIMMGKNDQYSVVLVSGIREEPFDIDGLSQKDKVYFTVITVTPTDYNPLAEYNFSVKIGNETYNGKLNKHPYNQSYSVEINVLTSQPELDITISHGNHDSIVTLNSVIGEDFINGNKAYQIAEKKLKDKISAKGGNYEVFVRLIENPINANGGYFWYVAFIFEDETTYAVLIDPVSMEIQAIKE